MAAASANQDALYRSLANQARLAFASVNTVPQLEKTFFAVGIYVV